MMVFAACDLSGIMDWGDFDNTENPDFGDKEDEDIGNDGSGETEENTYITLHKLKSYAELEMSEPRRLELVWS